VWRFASFSFFSCRNLNFLNSINLATEGLASGAISTRSMPASWAFLSASDKGKIPSCLPSSPMTLSWLAVI